MFLNCPYFLRRLLVTDNYDSVNNFLLLHDAFERSSQPLYDVYEAYAPPIRTRKHTCVGLGLELIRRLRCLNKVNLQGRETMIQE